VYILRDAVFDEAIFPFQALHPNAGTLLRKEILLLDSSLRKSDQGDAYDDDSHMVAFTSNPTSSTHGAMQVPPRTTAENLIANGGHNDANDTPTGFLLDDSDTEHEEDSLTQSSSGLDRSVSDQAPDSPPATPAHRSSMAGSFKKE
jgi:hypothetical protein